MTVVLIRSPRSGDQLWEVLPQQPSAALLVMAFCMQWRDIDGMSKSITIRNVPDDTGAELAARAALTGRSLQEYLRSQLIELARRPEPDVVIARARERKDRTGSRLSAEKILAHLDAGRD